MITLVKDGNCMRVELVQEIVSQNVRDRIHWAERSRIKDRWERELLAKRPPYNVWLDQNMQLRKKVKITRQYNGRQKKMDIPNLWGGAKDLIDALVQTGYLDDDSDNCAEFSLCQKYSEDSGTIVEIGVEDNGIPG